MNSNLVLVALRACFLACVGAVAAPLPALAGVAPPRDVPYAGVLKLNVDATDLERRIFRVREEIPVVAGPLTLLYPQWLPGKHAPRGAIEKLAGLVIRGNGQPLEWRRDSLDMHAFHLDVPAGVTTLVVEFEFLSAQESRQGRVVVTPEMLNLQWETVALYPAGHHASRIMFAPSVRLPQGWRFGSALEVVDGATPNATAADGGVSFKPVTFDVLVDSPMFAGRHFKRVDLGGKRAPVHLNIVADEAKQLEIQPKQLQLHRNLIEQAHKLFGSQQYDHYDFLLALSDRLGGIGLEHHRSSENSQDPGYFTEWDKHAPDRDLLAHEYTHSWNGKFRRPAGLATPNFNVPMQDDLLWVYEGQTQYWGHVLSARSGLWSAEQARDALAGVVATYADNRPGFAWRNLADTSHDPIIAARRPLAYRNYQMSEDYYSAGALLWLAVDAQLRELSRGRRSLDDFARAFFGIEDGSHAVRPYVFEDVVEALDAVAPHDWSAFLRTRLEANAPPLDGLAASGWRLVYTDQPSAFQKTSESNRASLNHAASIGLSLGSKDGRITDVRWNGPAFKAGIVPTSILVAVNGRAFSAERLKDAIAATKDAAAPIELLVRNGDEYVTRRIDYRGGLKYPHLERIPASVDRLGAILAPR